jgi:predicted ribosome-associated RNA-binding protein Tma20
MRVESESESETSEVGEDLIEVDEDLIAVGGDLVECKEAEARSRGVDVREVSYIYYILISFHLSV